LAGVVGTMTTKGFDILKDLPSDAELEHKVHLCLQVLRNTGPRAAIKTLGLRQVCSACSYLRARIHRHDEKFFLREGRLPSEADRTMIASLVEQHRELKVGARTAAAIRIEALARGRRGRRVVRELQSEGMIDKGVFLDELRKRLAAPQGDPALRASRKIIPGALEAIVARVEADRQLAGLQFPSRRSPAEALHSEKALLKRALKQYVQALTDTLGHEPNAMDLEAVKPAFLLYHTVDARIAELQGLGMDYEDGRRKEAIQEDKQQELREEALRLKAILSQYEAAFMAKHGRKMKSQAEVAPVSKEYARFKEIKSLLQ